MSDDAAQRLSYGDHICDRLRARSGPAALAAELGKSVDSVKKAAWLARAYPMATRRRIGQRALRRLKPSHIEAVAARAHDLRVDLLRRAADEGLSVRQLKALAAASAPAPPGQVMGTADQLDSARRAAESYARWTEEHLRRLLAGPNGTKIHGLARAGRALAERIDQIGPGP